MWEITYIDKWTGKERVRRHAHNEASARRWTQSLARNNGCKAVCEKVDAEGNRRHIVSEGDA